MKLFTCPKCGYIEETKSLIVGTIKMDNYTVFKNNQPLSLSKTEFALLKYLMVNQYQVLTREMILEQVWHGFTEYSRVVDVYVGYLRKKLGFGFIKTVPGFGYTLKENQQDEESDQGNRGDKENREIKNTVKGLVHCQWVRCPTKELFARADGISEDDLIFCTIDCRDEWKIANQTGKVIFQKGEINDNG